MWSPAAIGSLTASALVCGIVFAFLWCGLFGVSFAPNALSGYHRLRETVKCPYTYLRIFSITGIITVDGTHTAPCRGAQNRQDDRQCHLEPASGDGASS